MAAELLRGPLHEMHVALGAKLVAFGGWDMPLQYPSGTVAEHLACRRDAVMFDVSHLGTVRVRGPRALQALQAAFTNDLGRIAPGAAQYTHLLDEADGSVLDDIIVWWRRDDTFDVMPNASNTSRVARAIGDADRAPSVADVTAERAVVAVQGPQARRRLAEAGAREAAEVGRFKVRDAVVAGVAVTVAGTGYTGEDGVEMAVAAEHAEALWRWLADIGVRPAGLGARDTLRLEAGLPLHGHELGPGITPLQARLGWVVRWDKGDFRGRAALDAERQRGPRRLLAGLIAEGRRPPRQGCTVRCGDEDAGIVTSGNFSPVLERGVALALLSPQFGVGDRVVVDVRGRELPAEVVDLPFSR